MTNDRILNLTYDDLASFTYDAALIESNGNSGLLKLLLNPGQIFTQDFSSYTDFIYNNLLAEFIGGKVQQKDQTPLNSVIGANFDSSFNLNWAKSGGSLTALVIGSPVLSGGKIQCRSYSNNGVRFTNAEVGSCGLIGGFYAEITPQYSGTPSQNCNIFDIFASSGNSDKKVLMHSSVDGRFRFTANDSTGTSVHLTYSIGGAWIPVAGTTYKILFLWNTALGIGQLYIDGVLKGSIPTTAFTCGSSATNIQVGAGISYSTCNADFDNVCLFNVVPTVQAYTIPNYIYANNKVSLPTFSYYGIGSIQSIDDVTITQSGTPKWITGGYWFNGSAWVVSNGTYSEANTASELAAAVIDFPVEGAGSVTMEIVFPDSNTISWVDLFSIEITGQKYSVDAPSIIKTIGTYLDGIGAITITKTLPAGTSIKVLPVFNNLPYKWDTDEWVAGTGVVSEAMTEAEFNAIIGSFPYSVGKIFQLKVFLITTDENATPLLTSISMTYDFAVNPSYPQTCKMWGFLTDDSGQPIAGATITFSRADGYIGNNLVLKSVKATSNSQGYYEKDLVISDKVITETVSYLDENNQLAEYSDDFIVPNENEPQPIAENLAA